MRLTRTVALLLERVEQRPFEAVGTNLLAAYVEMQKAGLVRYGPGGFLCTERGRAELAAHRLETTT